MDFKDKLSFSFEGFINHESKQKVRTILSVTVNLTRKDMLSALDSELIVINGKYYQVPEHELLQCLQYKRFGNTRLDLTEVIIPET